MKAKLKEIFLGEKAKDIYKRSVKTFFQAFFGAITLDVTTMSTDLTVWKPILLGAIAAGISAVMNLIINAFDSLSNDYY